MHILLDYPLNPQQSMKTFFKKQLQTSLSEHWFLKFQDTEEAWPQKLNRHFPDVAFLHIKQKLTNSH